MTPATSVPSLVNSLVSRWAGRDERIRLIDAVVSGDWTVLGQDDEALENRSPNLIQVALEDTAEAASIVPTVRMIPSTGSERSKKCATAMERRAVSYLDVSQIEMLEIKSFLDLVAFGFFTWVVVFDRELGTPKLEWRDPRTCYPEHGWHTMDSVRRCVFTRDLYVSQLPAEHQALIEASFKEMPYHDDVRYEDARVTLVEVYAEDEILLVATYLTNTAHVGGKSAYCPVELERIPTVGGICPVVIGQRPTLDGEPRGQFDQVVGVMQAHIRLMAMVLDYSDQAVYSDIWVKDLVGEMPYGGGAVIQLGPQGSIGRVSPAVSSLQVQQELDSLVTNLHVGGRWPKTRPGEVDQSIASAKFVEATAGMMNTVIRTLHLVMKRALEQSLRIAFLIDNARGPERTIAGVLRNQQFLVEARKSEIDLKARVRIDYGIGLGRDPAQTMVLGIQGMQTGMFSKEYVQENFEGLTDVAGERQRIDVEQLKDMAMAQLLEGLTAKTIPPAALVEIARGRQNGDDVFELFKKYVVDPQTAQQDAMLQPGLPGMGPAMPGAMDPNATPGPGGGLAPPAAPPPGDLMAALAGGPPGPPGQEGPGSIGRLSIPLGGGGFAGTESRG